ncbi:MAG: asparagine synthase (glutamine-hydrolyzing) [Alphaproteobacteria bacterium]|nr:asparagine synthase (glutamine-hydrolyzing) [Alphaproteobacteria bacterium]
MCGFAGFLDPYRRARSPETIARNMAATLVHRGPDDDGCWVDETAGIALGFRRLSILDLSTEGHQPMVSQDGRYVIVYNGEVYSYLEIRRDLDAEAGWPISWRGHSDTEVLLAAVVRWGIARTLDAADGMFAFALWDRQERTLVLARDRLGEKPLYYGWCGGAFLFGSELKALRRHPAWVGDIDRSALGLYMRLGWIPAPHTIYRHVAKLPPGCTLTLTAAAGYPGAEQVRPYWSARQQALAAAANPFQGDFQTAADHLEALLRRSVALRMRADVPVGVFLSGGIDSSTLAAMMQAETSRPVHSFTIGFAEPGHDESSHARAVARHIGTEHTGHIISEADVLALVPRMPMVYDEPMADAAQVPTCLLSALTRRQVAVALSGDGGDELLGGYPRYEGIPRQWNRLRRVPPAVRSLIGGVGEAVPAGGLNAVSAAFGGRHRSYPGYRLRWSLRNRGAGGLSELLRLHHERWRGTPMPVRGAGAALTAFDEAVSWGGDAALSLMVLDAVTYLPDDLCVKTDRASMAFGLETRLPFLDHHVAEFAWSLPTEFKIAGGVGKRVLRDVLYRLVPREIVDRPKQGFTVPIDRWLRGSLRPWADDLLAEDRLRREGYLDAALVSGCWRDHRAGRRNWQTEIWFALMFQAWLEQTGLGPAA